MATKCIIGYALRNKTYGEVSKAIDYVDDQHKLVNHKLQRLVFDRESAIAVMQEEIESRYNYCLRLSDSSVRKPELLKPESER